jgi:DNA primase
MILDHVLRSENSRKDYELVAVPGANVFKPEQAKILSTRRIILIYDNDDAGAKGVKRVVKEAAELVDRPTSIQHLVWDETKGKGYDVRDLYHSYSE